MPLAAPVTTTTLSRRFMLGYDTSHSGQKIRCCRDRHGRVRRVDRVSPDSPRRAGSDGRSHSPANSRASSGGETRIIRMSYGPDEIYTRGSMRSLEFGKQILRRQCFVEPASWLRPRCAIRIWWPPGKHSHAPDANSNGWGIPHCGSVFRISFPIVTRPRCMNPAVALMARRAVRAVVDAAVRAGAHYETRRLIEPDRKLADTFVFACGPWLPKIFPEVIGARIRPTRQEVFFYGTPAADRRFADMPVWISFREGAYTIPALDGRGFKLAIDEHGPPLIQNGRPQRIAIDHEPGARTSQETIPGSRWRSAA